MIPLVSRSARRHLLWYHREHGDMNVTYSYPILGAFEEPLHDGLMIDGSLHWYCYAEK